MAHHLTNAEVENKVAFFVQLHALLTQVSAVVSNNALGSAQKAKLGDIRAATEAWLKDVGKIGVPRPSITPINPSSQASSVTDTPTTPSTAASPALSTAAPAESILTTNDAVTATAGEEVTNGGPNSNSSNTTVSAKQPTGPANPVPPASKEHAASMVPGSSSSFTTDIGSAYSVADGRSIVDLVGYLRLLFDNDMPERTRLQAFGKNLVRLLMVRCCSTIMASLQHVVHQTYATASAAAAAVSATLEVSGCDSMDLSEGESPAKKDPSSLAAAPSNVRTPLPMPTGGKIGVFVELAREINVATQTLLGSVQLMTNNAVTSDAASSRFPVQLCVDVVKQTRRALLYFQSRIEKEELYILRSHLFAERVAASTAGAPLPLEDVDAAQEAMQQEPAEDAAVHVRRRAESLEAMWGPSLTHSIRHIGDVIEPAVKFLVSVAGVREDGAASTLVSLEKDAARDLFTLCGVAIPSAVPLSSGGTARSSAVASANGESSSPVTANGISGAVTSPVSASSVTSPTWRAVAGEVLISLGSSYTADYLASVARCCGDSNGGQLLATRLLADMLDHVATHDVQLLRWVLHLSRWSRPLYEGILNCVVSIQPGVLAAGLDALRLLTVNCPAELGQDVGYLYSNVVLRLLESSNSPHYVKRTIVLHLLTTLVSHSSTVSTTVAAGVTREIPLILYLYRLYDLDVHAHQLNFVQQFTSALSRIVRSAPKEDFAQDAIVQEQLRRQQATASLSSTPLAASTTTAEPQKQHETRRPHRNSTGNNSHSNGTLGATAAASTTSGKSASGSSFDATLLATLSASLTSLSLPAMALHGLVRIVELLTTQTPPEEESGRDVPATLQALQNREWKLKEQQQVDLFNASPTKAVYNMFSVTAEEKAIPEEHSDFAGQWDHTRIPPVLSPETAKKVEDVVDFLTSISSLDPAAVSEFLTTPAVFPLQVCSAYLRRLPLAGSSVLEAISELLMRVQLPREGQRIERLLEYFSAAYFDANDLPGVDRQVFPFKNDTAVFIVVVATVMLNTNIHNPSAGMRLDLKSFRGQLHRCNDDESFSDTFVDDIFYSISTHPLESIKPITIDTGVNADGASKGSFDLFFVSQEEKRQLAFGVERQRIVSETRQLLQLRTRQEPRLPLSSQWWCAAAKDLFLSTWSAVCAVFGPAMYEGTSAPLPVLLQCVRGLQSLLCTAAAFDLPTECTVTLLTLLRMAEFTPVRAHCRRAVLVVAATAYAVHFPVRCWVAVCQLMLELRLSSTSAVPPLVEDVFTRIENLTRLSVEADEKREAAAAAAAADEKGESAQESAAAVAPAVVDKPTQAIHCVLEGIMTTIGGYAVGDVANMSAALVLLRRALEFTRIIHGARATDVVYYVNIRDFTAVVVPAYVELIKRHSLSDEGLQVLFECLVEILCTMWLSYSAHRVVAPASVLERSSSTSGGGAHFSGGAREAGATKEKPPVTITVDTAPVGFTRCFRCLRSIYDVTLTTATSDGSATLLQMHVLQAVKEVLTRTAHAVEVTADAQHLSLYTMVASWQQALYPLGMALSDRRTTTTETGSLALLVLRKLVAVSGGTGGISSDRLPPPVRGALLWLLAQLAYMGGMCGDADGAQVCVALLSSICTTTLAMSLSASSPAVWSVVGPSSLALSAVAADVDIDALARAVEQRDALTQRVVASIEESPEYIVQRTLARLGLLLRCEREQTRAEVVHQLRTLSLQMRPPQVQAFAMDLAEVVLEGAIGHAAHHHKTPITHSSLIPFFFYQMPVPAAMRRCSRTAFRATLPAALGFLASELLSGLSGEHLAATAESVMQRCLVPILLSPNSPYQNRFLAVRSLSQCIAVCLPQNGETPRPSLAQSVLDCLSLSLYAVQVPLPAIMPPTTAFIGRRWLDVPPATAAAGAEWLAYGAAATQVMRVMDTAEPEWVVRGTGPPPNTTTAAEEEESAVPPQGRGNKTGGGSSVSGPSATFLTDEPLVEYVNLLAQVLAGLPKEMHGIVQSATSLHAGEEGEVKTSVMVASAEVAPAAWALPHTSVFVLLQLTLRAAGTLFAILWRINHPYEIEQYALQSVELGREAPALIRNSGLLPHAAIRSVLQCYLELAMLSVQYPTSEVLASMTDIIEGIRQVQTAAQPSHANSTPSSAGAYGNGVVAPASASLLVADATSLQRLSPQDQQHVRTCNSGMYQQLATVLSYLVKLLTGQANFVTTTAGEAAAAPSTTATAPGWTHRKEAFEAMAMHPQFFSSLVSLLTPTAGTLIVTVRDYFAWYIVHAEQLSTVAHLRSEAAAVVVSEKNTPADAAASSATPGSSRSNGHASDEHAHTGVEYEAEAPKEVETEVGYDDDNDLLL